MSTAIYPGTFDPVTLGHLDVVERGCAIFGRIIVGVGDNPEKESLFTLKERLQMMREETKRFANVEVHSFTGLVVEFARKRNVSTILRGIRTVSDLEYEVQMAFTNRVSGGVETVFIAPRPEYAFLNARFIKEIAAMGGDVSRLVTPRVAACLRAKCARRGGRR